MQIKKSTFILSLVMLIIFLNEKMFYLLNNNSSIHVIALILITVLLLLVYIKPFYNNKFFFRGIILIFILINLVSLINTVFQFNQPLILAILRYKYIIVLMLYFPMYIMIVQVGLEKFKKLLVVLSAILSFFYIVQSFLYPSVIILNVNYADRFGVTRFYDGAFFITVGFFLTISYIYKGNLKYYIPLLLQLSYLVFVAQTRSAIIPIILIIIIIIISKVSIRNVSRNLKLIAIFVFGMLALSPYISDVFESINNDLNRTEGSAYIRVMAQEYMVQKIEENPFLGVGLYHNDFQEGKVIDGSIYSFYAEDVGIIGFIFQYGLMGLIVLIWMLFRFLKISYLLFKINRADSVLYFSMSLYLSFQLPFVTPLNIDNYLLYIIILMGLIQAQYNISSNKKHG